MATSEVVEGSASEERSQLESPAKPASGSRLSAIRQHAAWCVGVIRCCPHWVLGCLLIALLWLVDSDASYVSASYAPSAFLYAAFGVALFLPGAVKRFQISEIASFAAFGAIAPFAITSLIEWLPLELTVLLRPFLWSFLLMLLLGTAEWLVAPRADWRRLGWIAALSLAVAAVYAASSVLFHFSSPSSHLGKYVIQMLLVACIWFFVSKARAWAGKSNPRGLAFLTVGVVTSVAVCCWISFYGIYLAALASLDGSGPLDPVMSVRALGHRHSTEDYSALLQALKKADWKEEFEYPGGSFRKPDWRYIAVRALIRMDRKQAAKDLGELLVQHPSRQLIDMTDDLLIHERRYETMPIYLRYALLESTEVLPIRYVGEHRFSEAMDKWQVPQAVMVRLTEITIEQSTWANFRAQQRGERPSFEAEDIEIPPPLHRSLILALGDDIGYDVGDWHDLYYERIESAKTPVPAQFHLEANRVVDCFNRYLAASNRLKSHDRSSGTAIMEDSALREPDWDVPTIEALEDELLRFERQVEMAGKDRL